MTSLIEKLRNEVPLTPLKSVGDVLATGSPDVVARSLAQTRSRLDHTLTKCNALTEENASLFAKVANFTETVNKQDDHVRLREEHAAIVRELRETKSEREAF